MNRTVLIICSNRIDAQLIEFVARPARVTQIDGKLPIETLREVTRADKFDGAIIHLPNQIEKAVELKNFLHAVRYHARIRILPMTYGGAHLLSPAWKNIVRYVAHQSRKKVVQ